MPRRPLDARVLTELTGLEPLLTLDELAALSGESRRTIERRVMAGHIRVVRLSSRTVRVSSAEAQRYLDGVSQLRLVVAGEDGGGRDG